MSIRKKERNGARSQKKVERGKKGKKEKRTEGSKSTEEGKKGKKRYLLLP